MNISRRMFNRCILGITGSAALGLTMDGCNVYADILNWAPLGLAAFNALITMLETFGVITPVMAPLVGLVRTAFSDLILDVQLYQSIVPPPAGALAKIQAVLSLIAQNVKDLFAQVQTAFAPMVNLIIGLVQLLLGTVAGFQNQLPAGTSGFTLVTSSQFNVGRVQVTYAPIKLSTKQFKGKWNAVCASQGHPEGML